MSEEPSTPPPGSVLLWHLRLLERELQLHPVEAAAELEDAATRRAWLDVRATIERLLGERPRE